MQTTSPSEIPPTRSVPTRSAPTRSAPASQSPNQKKALRILAKSVFKELQSAGYDRSAMVGFTSELLEVVTDEMWTEHS